MTMAPSRGSKRTVNGIIKHSEAARQEDVVPKKNSNSSKPSPKVVNFPDSESAKETSTSCTSNPNLRQRSTQLLATRRKLPIWKHTDEIRSKLRFDDVLLLVGETGSGKSTQIPQFLVNEPWCRRRRLKDGTHVGGCIAITEPRRVAAISLARRVAEEMGTPLGTSSPSSQVGYSVRFDNSTGPATRIKFLTEGMLLQEMLRDPWLKNYSAVVVDEVHERGLNVDLVLGFLRRMQEQSHTHDERGGQKMKVIVMSATADMEAIEKYLTPGPTHANAEGPPKLDIEEEEWNGFSDHEDDPSQSTPKPAANGTAKSTVATLMIKGRQHPVTVHYAPNPVPDILEASLQRIIDINTHAPLPGDILVFLTGQETVESLLSLVNAYSVSIRSDPKLSKTLPSLLILPLYAALPAPLQQRVFQPTPKFNRKIIISTNIAETSITVPGIRHVVDCGKHKRRLFRPSLNLESLLTVPISRSSVNQRSGRAGRDAPGHAYRLYTEASFYSLAADTEPEILRCDLSQLLLTLKSHGIETLAAFPLLTTPPPRALERALVQLLQLSALSPTTGAITTIGREMSLIPLPSYLARILLSSALPQYDCVDEIIDIVSALSVENIFLNIHNSQTSQNNAESDEESSSDPRLELRSRLHRRQGDHLTLLAVVQAYVSENTDRNRWCEERGISHRAMQAVMDARKQLTGIMKRRANGHTDNNSNKIIENGHPSTKSHTTEAPTSNTNEEHAITTPKHPSDIDLDTRILRTLLTGLHTNVARLSSAHSTDNTTASPSTAEYLTLNTHQPVSIHPSSVLFQPYITAARTLKQSNGNTRSTGGRIRPEAIMSSEYVYTTKPYARCVSAVQLDWVRDAVNEVATV